MTTAGGMIARDGVGGAAKPNCCRISWLSISELSRPQFWQTKRIGEAAISGVTSNEYFVPQLH